jgi:hypothetical protein
MKLALLTSIALIATFFSTYDSICWWEVWTHEYLFGNHSSVRMLYCSAYPYEEIIWGNNSK